MRAIVTLALGLLSVCSAEASAQTWQPPSESQRCPSKWGAADERGSGNHMKPETVLRAARLIKTGEVFELGQVLSESMPLPAGRRFEIHTKRSRQDPVPTGAAPMKNWWCLRSDRWGRNSTPSATR